jgi:hypothetical protein
LPRWDVIWARRANDAVGFEIAGDRPPDWPERQK